MCEAVCDLINESIFDGANFGKVKSTFFSRPDGYCFGIVWLYFLSYWTWKTFALGFGMVARSFNRELSKERVFSSFTYSWIILVEKENQYVSGMWDFAKLLRNIKF